MVPTQDDSGWEVYRPAHTPSLPAPEPRQAAAVAPAPTPTPQRATPVHHIGARHRTLTRPPATHVVVRPEPTGAVLSVTPTTGAADHGSGLVLAALLSAIACLAFASAPTSQIRWRRGALFIADNRVGITSAGAACLLAAAILFVLARG